MSDVQKFRKKPVVIEAMKLTRENYIDVYLWMSTSWEERSVSQLVDGTVEIYIHTLEGNMTARQGDWIIKGVQGEFYPCKPDIFEQTYEPATPDVSPVPPTRENFCDDCGRFCTEKYLSAEHKCQRCQRIDEPCEFMPEPRGAFGIAQGWCRTHDVGWIWCEHAKTVSAPPVAPSEPSIYSHDENALPDNELPGMWEHADYEGGRLTAEELRELHDSGRIPERRLLSPAPSVGELEWREIECEEYERRLNGHAFRVFSSCTDPDGVYGQRGVYTEWGIEGDDDSTLKSELLYDENRLPTKCTHWQRILSGAAEEGK